MHCNILCVIVTCYNMFCSVSRTPAPRQTPSQTWTRPLPNKPRPPLTRLELQIVGMPHSVVIMMIMHLNHTMFLPVPVKVPPEAKKDIPQAFNHGFMSTTASCPAGSDGPTPPKVRMNQKLNLKMQVIIVFAHF